ncbi:MULTISPECIES: GFA family protein [unclassified Vibrio]|uniref:GFA family protein n=1 Tax=unclassified Vibrio TaxID=2614977 RepID=UPI000B8E5212|nr:MULTISPECIES: GFA family protein [unclassified Vibrio]NAW88942.1 GFA family protein [Vibrio sp. V24_P1S3T111]OXX25945.1 aldehyde-activating protein [Vibrio sp. V06_P1A73T115]OXX26064.1 aldehyde-activating protein [Vibrio sp. V05_P4A8T149]OXX31293.1 aldehyde-activating protein [Vibrio sp. V14_P6S14T42]OXX39120.1 aldehyde-activating protein [Vibrio sp. V04_P4A5T148]
MEYQGSCHCGAVRFRFVGEKITKGLRCNCSICKQKGALMSPYTVSVEDIEISVSNNALETYEFNSGVAKHQFCRQCGIYTFHQTFRQTGYYRINLGCLSDIDTFDLSYDVFDGAAL